MKKLIRNSCLGASCIWTIWEIFLLLIYSNFESDSYHHVFIGCGYGLTFPCYEYNSIYELQPERDMYPTNSVIVPFE